MRASTSASQACGSTSLSRAVWISVYITAARPPPRSAPANSQDLRPSAITQSFYIGQEVEVHYRWHPLYGRRVRQHYTEQRASGRIVHIEVQPGVITVVAAWMLDPSPALAWRRVSRALR